jgi:hypothetical protein
MLGVLEANAAQGTAKAVKAPTTISMTNAKHAIFVAFS